MKLGIEKSKKAIKALTDLIERGEVVLADGKVTWIEGIGSGKELRNFVVSLFDMSDIIAEAKDYDESEKAELLQYTKQELDLDNDKAEILIEKFLEVASGISDIVGVMSSTISNNDQGQGPPDDDPDDD